MPKMIRRALPQAQRFGIASLLIAFSLGLSSCRASLTKGDTQPVPLVRTEAPLDPIVLSGSVPVPLSKGRLHRQLPAESRWRPVGAVPAGLAYKPIDWELVVRGSDAHEAYLVLENNHVQGAYLPVEKLFLPCTQPVPYTTN